MSGSFSCPACESEDVATEEFDSEEDMETHIRAVHLKWTPYQCFYCSKKAAGPHNLKKHAALQHFGETFKVIFQPEMKKITQLEAIRNQSDGIERNKSYACLRCEEEENIATDFESRSQLLAHIREIHLKIRPFSCQYCSLSSACWTNLRNHIRSRHVGAEQKIIITPDENLDLAVERMAQGFENSPHGRAPSVLKMDLPPSGIIPQTTSTPYALPNSRFPMARPPMPYNLSNVKVEHFYDMNRFSDPTHPPQAFGGYGGFPPSGIETTESSHFSQAEVESDPIPSNDDRRSTGTAKRSLLHLNPISTAMDPGSKRPRSESSPSDYGAQAKKAAENSVEEPEEQTDGYGKETFITTCRLCGFHKESLRYKSRRLVHVYQKHLPRKDFVRCPLCRYNCPDSRSQIVSHIKQKHPDENVEPIDDRANYRKQAEKVERTCFGIRGESEQGNKNAGEGSSSNEEARPDQQQLFSPARDEITAEQSVSDTENAIADTIECLLCHQAIDRNSEAMTEHVQSTHFEGQKIDCPVQRCLFSTSNYSGMRTHFGKKHKRVNVVPPPKDQFNETVELEKLYNTCFPKALPSPVVKSDSEGNIYDCQLCLKPATDRRDHVVKNHFAKKLLQCSVESCNFGIMSIENLWCLKQHFWNIHPDQIEFKFIDKRLKYEPEIENLLLRCFSSQQQGSSGSGSHDLSPTASQDSSMSDGNSASEETTEKRDNPRRRFCEMCQKMVHYDRRAHCYTHHLGVQSIFCPMNGCQFGARFNTSDVKRHIAKNHPDNLSLQPVDKRAEYVDQIRKLIAQAFPNDSLMIGDQPASSIHKGPRLTKQRPPKNHANSASATECLICKTMIRKGTNSIHIWRYHMDLPVLQCTHCEFYMTHNDKHRYHKIHGKRVHPDVEDAEPNNESKTPKVQAKYEQLYLEAYNVPVVKRTCFEGQENEEEEGNENEQHETTETEEGLEEQLAETSNNGPADSNES